MAGRPLHLQDLIMWLQYLSDNNITFTYSYVHVYPSHTGLSLKTMTHAYFLEDPPIHGEIPLKEWYNAHATEITSMITAGAYRDPTMLFNPPRPSEILPLEFAVSTIENAKTSWSEDDLTFIPGQQKIWYEACEKCLTLLDVDTRWKIMCKYCKEYTKVIVRFEFNIFLSHGTTVVPSILTSPEADKLLPYTADQVRLAAEENKPLTAQIEAALAKKHVACFLKYYDRDNRGIIQRCYPILKTYIEAELYEYNVAQQKQTLAAFISEDTSNELPSTGHIRTSGSTPDAAAEKQFITPTMKKVLEEVVTVPSSVETQSTQQPSAKRMLPFGHARIGQEADSSCSDTPECLITTPAKLLATEEPSDDASQTTLTKKSKTKYKQP